MKTTMPHIYPLRLSSSLLGLCLLTQLVLGISDVRAMDPLVPPAPLKTEPNTPSPTFILPSNTERKAITRTKKQDVILRKYIRKVEKRIMRNPVTPKLSLTRRDYYLTVRLSVSRDGQIANLKAEKIINIDPLTVQACLNAIQQSAPLPKFPPEIKSEKLHIVFTFSAPSYRPSATSSR